MSHSSKLSNPRRGLWELLMYSQLVRNTGGPELGTYIWSRVVLWKDPLPMGSALTLGSVRIKLTYKTSIVVHRKLENSLVLKPTHLVSRTLWVNIVQNILACSVVETDRLIIKFMWKCKWPRIIKTPLNITTIEEDLHYLTSRFIKYML